jgi:Holliday junction resolvase-like predicted endonuclease
MVNLIKASGDKQEFSENKYRQSLRRSGASKKSIDQAIVEIASKVKEGTTTKELYEKTHRFLKTKERSAAGHYSLKQAIMQLGPSGYPFEHFMGDLLKKQGYDVKVGQIIQGRCVTHEIDVIASKDGECIMLECKFRNRRGLNTAIKTSLYVKARFDDIEILCTEKKMPKKFNNCWIVTNTRLSSQARQFAECVGMKVLSWAYPKGHGLEKMVEETDLHPITCLTRLSKKDVNTLIKNDVVTCIDIPQSINLLKRIGFSEAKIHNLVDEAKALCRTGEK